MFSERAAVRKPEVLVDTTRSPGRNASASTRSSGRKSRRETLLPDQRVAELLVGEIRLLPESCRTSGRIYQKFWEKTRSSAFDTRSSAFLWEKSTRSPALLPEVLLTRSSADFWSVDQKFWSLLPEVLVGQSRSPGL